MALALRQEAAPTAAEIIETLKAAEARPDAALQAAVGVAGEIAPAVIAVVEEAAEGGDLSPEHGNLLFWGIHVLGAARRTELYQPLIRLIRQYPADELEELLGGATTETLGKIIISVFDGDAGALVDACADNGVDSFLRWNLIGALARLTFDGAVARDTTLAFLDRFEREPLAAPDDDAWQGWQDAIYLLGLEEMRERLHAACRDGRFVQPEGELEFCDQHLTIACNLAPGDPSLFDQAHYHPLGDPVEELQWVRNVDTEEDEDDQEESDPASAIALTEDEIEWLGAVFASDRMPDDAMSVEQIDGYFCALAMDADRNAAREAARAILGTPRKASVFESEEQADRAARLVARMWNTVIDRLDAGYAHTPILWGSEAPKAQAWAEGFIAGMQAARLRWSNAAESEEDLRMFLVPIFGLALNEGEEEEGLQATPEARADWIAMLPATTVGLHATMWLHHERERKRVQQPARSTKVGRNEPCPCGSGKKYKRCCGSPEKSLH
jgi:yecA family protein